MNMSMELTLSIMINVGAIAFFAGILKATQAHQEKIIGLLKEEFNNNFKRLEEKQDKHNSVIERQFKLEGRTDTIDEKINVANHRILDLEREIEARR